MERNERMHPLDPRPDEAPDDPVFPDDMKDDGAEENEDATRPDALLMRLRSR